jgi:hypothetical protein
LRSLDVITDTGGEVFWIINEGVVRDSIKARFITILAEYVIDNLIHVLYL